MFLEVKGLWDDKLTQILYLNLTSCDFIAAFDTAVYNLPLSEIIHTT